jgi:cytochrome c biogenesis protein CcdA
MHSGFRYLVISLLLISMATLTVGVDSSQTHRVRIYFNGACRACVSYTNALESVLSSEGIGNVTSYDYSSNVTSLRELKDLREKFGVPEELFGPVTTVVDDEYIFEGYLPTDMIATFVNSNQGFDELIVAQGLGPDSYRLCEDGVVLECKSSQGISECLSSRRSLSLPGMWSLVLTSGLVDGLNPCAFAVLTYFVGVVALHQSGKDVLKLGVLYILSVYLVYLGIGFGLMYVIQSSGLIQILARVLGTIVIAIAVLNIAGAFQASRKFSIRMPTRLFLPIADRFSSSWIQKSALAAALLFGGIVAVIEFPCTGGIYAAIVGILAAEKTNWLFVSYLLGYNLMFVIPLVLLLSALCGVTNFPVLTDAIKRRERLVMKVIRVVSGLMMFGLGLILMVR